MRRAVIVISAVLTVCACASQRKAARLREVHAGAVLSVADAPEPPELRVGKASRDTLKVTGMDGREVLIMKAVKDENGEMVATDVIDAAVVTARFRNIAERGGKVDICFDVTVPRQMQDSRWQLRFDPYMYVMSDTMSLERIVITGKDYRKAQLRGYEQYRRFLDSIVTDTTIFISSRQLEVFLRRNLPEVYKFKDDTTFVSDEEFASYYGVTQREAVEHYTWQYMVRRNKRRIANKDKMFRKYVRVPIRTEGLRLDTVTTNSDNDIVYRYIQTLATRPGLKKVEVSICGDIWQQDKRIYRIPQSDPLSFYISSLSSLADEREKYLTKITERRVEANTACYIDFSQGSDRIDDALASNREEISRIKDNLASLMENRKYTLDSIIVTASCSPEGTYSFNRNLSRKRSEAVSGYFGKYMAAFMDSVALERGAVLNLAGIDEEKTSIHFISRSDPENWSMLESLVGRDSTLTSAQKGSFARHMETPDPDLRENSLQRENYYKYLREKLYPRLRTVRFNFHLHRKGMVKDTIHTTVLDSTYMEGIQAIKDRDYKRAVSILRPYADYNSAVAYCAMDYNASSMEILRGLERNDKVEYLMAIIHSRLGEDQEAVQCYLNACAKNSAMINRGNLDPEISALIKKYGLNKDY